MKQIEPVIKYAEANFSNFVESLKQLSRIPSVSFDGFPKEEVERSAKAVAELLKQEGLENVEVLRIEGAHPYVYGDWLHQPGAPTLLLYAHHDVQPPGKLENWISPPFEPTEREGRLFGRGTADDKAGILVHTSAIKSFLATHGTLPLNVKIIIEGEEETSSEHLPYFLERYQGKLKADYIVLTDTGNFDVGVPSITTSLRGLVSFYIEVKSLRQSLHSGMWGGPVPDPVQALAHMLAAMTDPRSGEVIIPNFYDEVLPLSLEETKSYEQLHYSEALYAQQVGLLDGVQLIGKKAMIPTKLWRLPSISINTILAGNPNAPANIINESSVCKIGIRTVPDMSPQKTLERVQAFLRSKAPYGVKVRFYDEDLGNWWHTRPEGPAFEKAKAALTRAFGKPCVFIGQGGSIPFVEPFSKTLGGIPALLIGVEDPYTNAHSENESVHLEDLKKSIKGAIYLYESLASS